MSKTTVEDIRYWVEEWINLSSRENGVDRVGKPFQTIDAGDPYTFDATALKFGQCVEPKFGSFALGQASVPF